MKISYILNTCDREYTNAVYHGNASKQSQFSTIVPKIPYHVLQIKSKNISIVQQQSVVTERLCFQQVHSPSL